MNWNSKTHEWTDLKSVSVRNIAMIARRLRAKNMSIQDIAEVLDKSKSRIREYLRTKAIV